MMPLASAPSAGQQHSHASGFGQSDRSRNLRHNTGSFEMPVNTYSARMRAGFPSLPA